MSEDTELASLLVTWRSDLVEFVERHAAGLQRFETAEDLVQGIHLRALDRGSGFEYRSEKAFLAWMHTLARGYIVDRRVHWAALKRGSSRILRLTQNADTADPRAALEPASTGTGASTFASRREQLELAAKALAVLLPRDRDFVRWHSEGVSIKEQAERAAVTYDAAERGGARALDRFRKAFRIVSQRR